MSEVIHGDCLEVMPTLADKSVDLILTDPPYGLKFMGKDWDHGVPGVQFWEQALRVAKPGAHLMAFGGTRTFHRLAVAIEDAGWEIRDTLMWVYGSGFPKSLDVSKAIDKMDAVEEQRARRFRFTEWVRSTGVTAKQIDQATATNMGGHYTTNASQPAIMTRKHLEACRHLLGDVPEWVEREADIRSVESQNMAEREVIKKDGRSANESWLGTARRGETGFGIGEWDITAPATSEAKQWEGWGTALKPAWEPIILARKPLIGTVAENVLKYGTGGINVDGCRVESEETWTKTTSSLNSSHISFADHRWGLKEIDKHGHSQGRWPANLIHDGSEEVVGVFPYQKSGKKKPCIIKRDKEVVDFRSGLTERTGYFPSSEGSAARFFYCAKASRKERGEGNTHPTVKPLALMKYLITLGLPPGGVVLDPFAGSGTTAVACLELGREYICIEKSADYHQMILDRIEDWKSRDNS